MNEKIRAFLELLGVIESSEAAVKKKLGTVSQAKPPGPATLVVHDIGQRRISAITVVRKVTGLSLEDAITFAEILPWPILSRVSLETADEAGELLKRMGITVELIGGPKPEERIEDVVESSATVPAAAVELPHGTFVAVLTSAGLLPDRVVEGLQRFAGLSRDEAESIITQAPVFIRSEISEEVAVKIQRELQMIGAAVDIHEQLEYDRLHPAFKTPAGPEATDTDTNAPAEHSVRLLSAGPDVTKVLSILHELTGLATWELELLLGALPRQVLKRVDVDTAAAAVASLESAGASAELLWGRAASSQPTILVPGDRKVILRHTGPHQVSVIQTLRDLLERDSLVEIKDLIQELPLVLFEGVSSETAEKVKTVLEKIEAEVVVTGPDQI